jgi:hypothetical protein
MWVTPLADSGRRGGTGESYDPCIFRTQNNTSMMRTYFVQGMVKVRKYGMSEEINTKTLIWAGVMKKLTKGFGNVYTCHR